MVIIKGTCESSACSCGAKKLVAVGGVSNHGTGEVERRPTMLTNPYCTDPVSPAPDTCVPRQVVCVSRGLSVPTLTRSGTTMCISHSTGTLPRLVGHGLAVRSCLPSTQLVRARYVPSDLLRAPFCPPNSQARKHVLQTGRCASKEHKIIFSQVPCFSGNA